MAEVSELDAMKSIDDVLSGVSDPSTRDRILKWAWAKFSPTPSESPFDEKSKVTQKKGKKVARKKASKKPAKTKTALSMVKNLNLKPSGKMSFKEFVETKRPSSNLEKCVVAVYYVANILKEEQVSADQVFTCFKVQGWRVPANLNNTLQETASRNAWLDTANMSAITLTTHGENLIEHDLPKAKKGAK